jgi:Nif-specific regulatory protein
MERFAGRYALLRRLGQGGMGSVYLALDLSSRTECALKRLDPEMVRSAPDSLRREFEVLTRVRHPAVVAVYELGFAPDGTPFYTMEYVPGIPADRVVPQGDWRSLCFVAAQVTHGLEALHGAGVIHGDLKPSNLLVIPGDEPSALPAGVRLLDFGLAGLLDGDREGHRGTPGYAAPEVVRGEPPGVASDLYGLGATLYTLAAGRAAFAGRPSISALRRQQAGPPPAVPLEEAGVPDSLGQLILRLMAPSPGERPSDAREVRRELERIHPAARRSLAQCLQTERVVGRERELARLERSVTVDSRGPRVILLSGEPGVGKSALVGALAVRAALAGRTVIRLSCAAFEAPGDLATALLRRLAADAHADSDATDPSPGALAVLARDERSGGEDELTLLADAAAGWGRAIQHRSTAPLVLLDDCERLDPMSRRLIRRIALHAQSSAFRWVWAGRGGTAETTEDEHVLLEARQADRLALGPLDRDGAERLVAARLHSSAPRDLCDFLWDRAGGHPGMLVEFLRAAAERGAVKEGEAGLIVDRSALERITLPADFEKSLLVRLASLTGRAHSIAASLAAWGRPVVSVELRSLDPAFDQAALEELLATGLAMRNGSGRVSLCPPGLGRQILSSLGADERVSLHRAVLHQPGLSDTERFVHLRGAGAAREALAAAGRALAAQPDEGVAIEAAGLAEEQVPEEAASWQEIAGRLLLERGRHRAAIPYLERALDGEPGGAARPARWHLLSAAYLRAGRPAEVEPVILRALAENPPLRFKSLLLQNEASRLTSLGLLEAACARAQEALAIATASGDDEAIGTAALTMGGVLLALSRPAEAVTLAEQAEEACVRAGLRLGRVRAIGLRASAAAAEQNVAEAEQLYGEALSAARVNGLRLATEEILMSLATVLTETGRWSEAREAHAEAARIALEDGRPRGAAVAIANLAQDDGLTGRPARALRQARSSVRLTRAYLPRLEPFAWRTLAQAHRIAGRSRRAERAARRAVSQAMKPGLEGELDWCRIEYGRRSAAAGHWKEAEEVWNRAFEPQRPRGSVAAAILAALTGRAALRRRDFETASNRLATGEAWLAGRDAPYAAAHLAQLQAECALAQGRVEEGVDLAGKTLAALAALPAPADRAWAALEFARVVMAAGAGPRAPVGEWLEDAAGAFERLGNHPDRERTLALMVEWLRRTRVPAPAGLHDRDLIQAVSRLLDSLSDLQELSQRAMQLAVEQLDAERGVLLLADPQTGTLMPVVEHGAIDAATRDQAVGYSRRVVERVAQSGGSLLIGDAPSDPEALSESVVDLRLRSIVCVPLYVGGKVVGAVYLDDSRGSGTFSDADRGLLEGFAHLMAVAIEKSRGHEEVRRVNELLVGENLSLRREVGARFQPENFIGMSSAMQRILAVAERAAQTTTTVLITGENGTGKEMIARILHHNGKRSLGPFVAVNCGAIPETLLESELFGILPNVATGVRGRDGRFVQANGGTLFLDEIGDMPLTQQVALLSAIANREITPVGGGRAIPVDVRIIAATNRDLRKQLEEGAFREDLFYRLNVIPIEVPPLRERKADIPALAHHFAALFAQQQEREVPELSAEFLAALMQSDWPGNVRELQNYIERLMAMTPGRMLYPNPLPRDLEARPPRLRIERGRRLPDVVADLERRLVREALERSDGNQSRAARELGMTEQSLRYRLRKFEGPGGRHSRRDRKKRR